MANSLTNHYFNVLDPGGDKVNGNQMLDKAAAVNLAVNKSSAKPGVWTVESVFGRGRSKVEEKYEGGRKVR